MNITAVTLNSDRSLAQRTTYYDVSHVEISKRGGQLEYIVKFSDGGTKAFTCDYIEGVE